MQIHSCCLLDVHSKFAISMLRVLRFQDFNHDFQKRIMRWKVGLSVHDGGRDFRDRVDVGRSSGADDSRCFCGLRRLFICGGRNDGFFSRGGNNSRFDFDAFEGGYSGCGGRDRCGMRSNSRLSLGRYYRHCRGGSNRDSRHTSDTHTFEQLLWRY